MVRWDSPLFVVPFPEDPPYAAIWNTLTTGAKAPPTAAVAAPPPPPPNSLQILTNTTSSIVTGLLAHVNAFPGSDTYPIPAPPAKEGVRTVLRLPIKTPTLAEMQRHKRQFENAQIKAHTTGAKTLMTWSEGEVAGKFVSFLEAIWDTA
jgi:protein KTI12